MTEQPKSWRDVIKVHPAADLFPMMTPDELKALAEDISKHDILIPVTLWGPDALLLDGRNRLEALALAGFSAVDETSRRLSDHVRFKRLNEDVNPYEYVISANLHRRHLTTQQKLDLLDKVMKANPTISSRRVAKLVGVAPTTATKSRHKLEATGDVSTVDTSTDTKGRKQPTRKPTRNKRRDIDDYIAQKKARTAADAPVLAPQQIDIEDCIAESEKSSDVQPKSDDVALLPFIVRHGDRIVAAFAKHNDADDWARYRSANYGCRCTVSTVKEMLDAFEDGQWVDACTIAAG